MSVKTKPIHVTDLAKAIYEILPELGLIKGRHWTGKAHKIVNIVLNSIVEALRKGDRVWIRDFGIFETYTLKSRRCPISYYSPGTTKVKARTIITIPDKVVVKFTPSKSVLKELNDVKD